MGTLTRPHGIKGELRTEWYASSPLCLDTPLWLQCASEPPRRVWPCALRMHRGAPLLALRGVEDRSAAEALRGAKLLTKRECLPQLDAGEAYVHDLLGCTVLLPDQSRLGTLDHVEFPAGREVWAIHTDAGQEVLLPAVPEFIVAVDADAGTVQVRPPAGLLDVYLKP